eukprot:SM000162S02381  [mRNA]  locus=s162:259311:261268:+ [translate_table: standard]
MGCQGFLLCTLKLANFFLALAGVLAVVYAVWMLGEYNRHTDPDDVAAAVAVPAGPFAVPLGPSFLAAVAKGRLGSVSSPADALGSDEPRFELPKPWFIYAFLGAGVFIACVTFIDSRMVFRYIDYWARSSGPVGHSGHAKDECLRVAPAPDLAAHLLLRTQYTFGLGVLLLLQGTIAAALYLDRSWERDLPDDPTGELARTKEFVLKNLEICKWVGLAIISLEVLALLLAMTLRAMQDGRSQFEDEDDEYLRPAGRQPLLPRQAPAPAHVASLPPTASAADPRSAGKTDPWRTRMLDKYGLDTNEFTYNAEGGRLAAQAGSRPARGPEGRGSGTCTIL